ncbi:MAG: serine/threonine protein kinase, partial [Planctomycetes bacterium]|nr:serine/threonine protein kinase [Planctomycetota bacterium]
MEIRKLAPGDRVLDYRILERLGEGGFGEVFRAEHEVLGTIVAIKVPRDGTGLTALRHEGVVQASLDHENIVATRELSISYDPPFIVMDYIDGDSLAELLRREGPLSWRRATRVLLEVARGLHHAHQRGVVHGDVKPANILVEPGREGRVLLTDFGLGRVFEGPQGNLQISRSLELATSGAEVQGTIRYLAPELLRGEVADERADVYSFGVLLFETLTGGLPEGREIPSDLCPKVPAELDEIFIQTFARREKRPRSLASTLDSLRQLLGEGLAPQKASRAPRRPGPLPTPTLVSRDELTPLGRVRAPDPTRPSRAYSGPQGPTIVPPVGTSTLLVSCGVSCGEVSCGPSSTDDCFDPPSVSEVVQALPVEEPTGLLATAAAEPGFRDWRRTFLKTVANKMSGLPGIETCDAGAFDLAFGVSQPGDPQHRVYVLCLPRVNAELALAAAEEARQAFEAEKGIWEKEVTFWVVAHDLEDKDQVLWTFKSFCMGWWRRRRIVLHTPKSLFASELGCDPKGNQLKRTFGAVCGAVLASLPRHPTPVTQASRPYPRRRTRGAAWGASVALMMTCGLLGSLGALELASLSIYALEAPASHASVS